MPFSSPGVQFLGEIPIFLRSIVLIVIRRLVRLRDTGASLEHLHVCQASYNGFLSSVTSADKNASWGRLGLMLHLREAEQEGFSWLALDVRLMPAGKISPSLTVWTSQEPRGAGWECVRNRPGTLAPVMAPALEGLQAG